ncbi:hypothetical protein [Pantoea sp. BAV 3049]|uniref:hypothetical protein n=1 Tax=Pantoea sp. BAV 3049 TaxID=2654188 RepID=UPI00131BEA57|nr:hypothetical protein [Pantoea sp. BAV 3049]
MKISHIFVLIISLLTGATAYADEYDDAVSKLPVITGFPEASGRFGHYEKMAIDLIFRKQEIRAYFLCTGSSNCSKEIGIFINKRNIGISPGDLSSIIINRFSLCNDLDAFTEYKGTTDGCKQYMYEGVKQWVVYSKDKNISRSAWEYGERQSGSDSRPLIKGDAWNFNTWNGYIRVAKSHGM